MQENYLISILGKQIVEGEKGEISLTTFGSYTTRGDKRYIVYNEYDEETPGVKTTSVLKIEDNKKITLIRNGEQHSRLILEKGKRHLCHYDTGYGSMMVGVFANKLVSDLNEHGGDLEVHYSLDINAGLSSLNEIFINVKEAEPSHVKHCSADDQ